MRQPVPFGKYLLLDRISVGGMAEVFKAKSYGVEGFEKVIAIKRILPSMGEDADFITMFIDEAKIAGQLSHANICQIFELGKIDGSHFIAMEYIWGKDLLQIQNRAKRRETNVPVLMACYIIAKACEGLHYAHRKKDALGNPVEIVHRDCSPQNILVSYEGEVKVIDFGIARAASRSSRTQAGVLKGKFGYMSPEQVRGLPLDQRSDVFSLGTVLYETLTGERLFVGESDFSTLERVRNADVKPPSKLNQAIPPEVERIVMKALARDRDKRYQSGAEMQADLQAYLTTQEEVVSNKGLGEAVRALFMTELEREKEQMERYKRVGRDGLIKGVPQAKAKLDIDEELGHAAPLDGDPTVLGGPDFDAIFGLDGGFGGPKFKPKADGVAPAGEAGAKSLVAENMSSKSGEPAVGEVRSPYVSEFDDKPTEIFSEDDPRIGAAAAVLNSMKAEAAAKARANNPRPASERPTILVESAAGADGGGPAGSDQQGQHRVSGSALSPRPMTAGAQSPLAEHDGRPIPSQAGQQMSARLGPYGQGNAPHPGSSAPGGIAMGAPVYPQAGPGYANRAGPMGPAQMVSLGTHRPRQKGIPIRDISIGLAIAVFVLIVFMLGRFVLSDGSDDDVAADGGGSITVSLAGAAPGLVADVRLDGVEAGEVTSDSPLILPAQEGEHEVVVSATGSLSCRSQVAVSSRGPAEFLCKLAPAPVAEAVLDAGVAVNVLFDGGVGPSDGGVAVTSQDAADDSSDVASSSDPKGPNVKKQKDPRPEKESKGDEREDETKEANDDSPSDQPNSSEDANNGFLVAYTAPFARIIIDGKNTGKMTPINRSEKIALSPGSHTVTFVVGSKKFRYRVKIEPGKVKVLNRELPVGASDDNEEDNEDEEDDEED